MTSHVHAHGARHAGAPEARWAWWCVVAWFPTAVLAFVAGEGLATLLGQSGDEVPPWWVAAAVLLATTAVLAVPTALAVWFDRRARRSGDERGRVPALLLLVLTGGFVLVNIASWAMRTVLG
jgi:hypothetical protein